MYKAFKYRIYPTEAQKVLIAKHIGACRFVYNLALETKMMAWNGNRVNLSAFDLMKQLTELKQDLSWLKEVGRNSLEASISDLDSSFKSFWGGGGFPSYKKKSDSGAFNARQNIRLTDKVLCVTKFQEGIPIAIHRPIKGTIRNIAISRTPTGKYFASILCETGEAIPEKPKMVKSNTVGIDLGIKTFIVTSDGKEYDNPKFLRKAQSKVKFIQSRRNKYKGQRIKHRLAILHEKVANQRKDFLHKTSSEIIKNHDSIAIENLNVSGMLKNHKLAGSISDAGWGEFVRQLEYKASWYGKNIFKIGRFEPSSKTCSCCGLVNRQLTLKDREWTCKCGVTHDRDLNAAINIKNIALSRTDRENQGELSEISEVMTLEASLEVVRSEIEQYLPKTT